jgi:16S rRNA processing protein RimM
VSGQGREIQEVQRSGRHLRLKLTGIDDREAAKALRDVFIEVLERDLDPLPPGEYYRFQLLGLTVRSIDGQELGRVVDVLAAPENDVYVTRGDKGDVLIPAVDDVVRDIDLSSGVIVVEIVSGLLPP